MASSGNRTRAARVAGEHSTTEPTMLRYYKLQFDIYEVATDKMSSAMIVSSARVTAMERAIERV